jgi:uncharacterized protein HemY
VAIVGRKPLNPRFTNGLNNQAWRLVTGPAEEHNPVRALELVKEALEHQPDNPHFMNTLGVVRYRWKEYKESITALEKSLAGSKGRFDASNLHFLATCHAKLGAQDKAKDCFDRAVKWVEGQEKLSPQKAEELRAFRAEAESVLGLK